MYKPIDGKGNGWVGENEIWQTLNLEKYFMDTEDNDELLNELYVEYTGPEGPGAEYEPTIHHAYPDVLKTEGIHTPDGEVKIKIKKPRGDHDCEYLAEFICRALHPSEQGKLRYRRSSKRLLVVLGGIGEGKTTLLEYFFRRYAKKISDLENIIRFNIDFEEMANIKPSSFNEEFIASLMLEAIDRQFPELRRDKTKLLKVLDEPLKAQEGLLEIIHTKAGLDARNRMEAELIQRCTENPLVMAAALINYLVDKENKKVVVTLDNVDRLPTAECQSRAITQIRMALRQWDCCAIVCVREYTYGKLYVMSEWGFERPLLYHKRPPRFSRILQQRFKRFPIEENVKISPFEIGGKEVQIEEVERFVVNIAKFLWTKDIENCLFQLSNGSVRQMLEIVRAFLSFHALDMKTLWMATFAEDPREAERIERLETNFDNLIRSITVGNYKYYSGNPISPATYETFILNMIGGPQDMPLLPYRILTYLRRYEIVNIKPLIEKAIYIGATKQQVQDVLENFLKSYLIESMQGVDIKDVQEVIITRKGVYYFDILSILAVYFENVMNDTWWDKIVEPYEQESSLKQEEEFLKECVEQIYQMEEREYERIERKYWVAYEEFLDRRPYCERVTESILSHLRALKSRGTGLPKGVIEEFEKKLEEIQDARRRKFLPYSGMSKE